MVFPDLVAVNSISPYTTFIGAYSSIFELSVAMNFTYAASESFRETIKTGFLQNVRNMGKWYDNTIADIDKKITLMPDEDISQEIKDKIKNQLQITVSELKVESEDLKEEIESSQAIIANETKPVYIYTALFSLFMLFFAGQEVAHNCFPKDGVNTILYFTIIFYIIRPLLSFLGYIISSSMAIAFAILAITSALFFPIIYQIPISNKYLLDTALIIAFTPFIFSASKLLFITAKIEFSFRKKFYSRVKYIKSIEENADNLRDSRDYFKNGM